MCGCACGRACVSHVLWFASRRDCVGSRRDELVLRGCICSRGPLLIFFFDGCSSGAVLRGVGTIFGESSYYIGREG